MNNPFDYFDMLMCINLDHRKDRWQLAQKEFKKLGILNRVQRFSAIEKTDGRVGVIKSNLEIVKLAKAKKAKNVLVFEDDVKFIWENEPLKNLELAVNQAKTLKWQLFYLGANTHQKLIKFNKNLILLKNAFAVHSMAYDRSIYDNFIAYAENVNEIKTQFDILDVYLASQIQANHLCLMVNPILTTQRESYSDIEKTNVNYQFIIDRFNQNIK
jgi:GR25 family glycosyltransferase involved in LPS biosynthesis